MRVQLTSVCLFLFVAARVASERLEPDITSEEVPNPNVAVERGRKSLPLKSECNAKHFKINGKEVSPHCQCYGTWTGCHCPKWFMDLWRWADDWKCRCYTTTWDICWDKKVDCPNDNEWGYDRGTPDAQYYSSCW